jgi:hypothetical protein
MDIATWSEQLDALHDALERLQRFFQDREPTTPLAPPDLQALERLFDQYLRAEVAVASQIEVVLRRSTKRPRR